MSDTTIDFIKVPFDENGQPKYDGEILKQMYLEYKQLRPERIVICLPEDIDIVQDVELDELVKTRNILSEMIRKKRWINFLQNIKIVKGE